ncbi:hypothetical protein Tco_1390504 [Tanacetum coccineum]
MQHLVMGRNAIPKSQTLGTVAHTGEVKEEYFRHCRGVTMVNAQHLTTKVNRTSANMIELVGLMSRIVQRMETSAPPASATAEGENEAQPDD